MTWNFRIQRRIKSLPPSALAILALLVLWIVANGYFGWRYFPFRDDWSWFGRPNVLPAGPWGYFRVYQLYAYRPVSFFLDVMLWSRFWPSLTPVSVLFTLLVFVTAVIYRMALSRITGQPMWSVMLVMLWWPLIVEGQYWLAAAGGDVLALLALGLWMWMATVLTESPHTRWLGWLGATLILTLGNLSYEQQWFVTLLAAGLLVWRRPSQWHAISTSAVSSLGIAAAWYLSNMAGLSANGKHANHSIGAVWLSLKDTIRQLWHMLGQSQWHAWVQAVTTPGRLPPPYWVLVLALTVLAMWAIARTYPTAMTSGIAMWPLLAIGVLWIGLAYAPWLLTHYHWIADRSVYAASPGIGLIIEALTLTIRQGVHHILARRGLWAAATTGLALLVGLHTQDIHAYQVTGQFDQKVARLTLKQMMAAHLPPSAPVLIRSSTLTVVPWDYPYHDHVATSWGVAWGPRLMWEDLSHYRFHPHVTLLYPGQAVPSTHFTYQVVLIRGRPAKAQCAPGTFPCMAIQYHDQWPRPRVTRWKIFTGPRS